MIFPVKQDQIDQVLREWLGSLFLINNESLKTTVYNYLITYDPRTKSFFELRHDLETILLTQLNGATAGKLYLIREDGVNFHITSNVLENITDDVMGIVFDTFSPFSANYLKLNEYALSVHSLSAMRVIYQKYDTYISEDERIFLKGLIIKLFPKERWERWLNP